MKRYIPLSIITFLAGWLNQSCRSNPNDLPEFVTFSEIINSQIALDSFYTQGIASVDLNNDLYPELYMTNSWEGFDNHFYHNLEATYMKDSVSFKLSDMSFSNGCTFADLNNDGFLDLCLANANDKYNQVLFGSKTLRYSEHFIDTNAANWSYSIAIADVDNDGSLEAYISNFHSQKNMFYDINETQFIEIDSTEITRDTSSTLFSAWSDLNNDGLQDLIVCNDSANYIFRNEGNQVFTRINNHFSIDKKMSYGCSVADYNNDGLMDIFITNWAGKNCLFKNNGNFKFEKLNIRPFNFDYHNSEGSCWGDYDNDGYTDLFITNDGVNILYKNLEGKAFEKQLFPTISDTNRNSNGMVWTDYNLDGGLDIIIANGGNQRNQIFKSSRNRNNWVKIKLEGTISNRSAIGSRVIVYSSGLIQHQEIQAQSGGGCGSQKPYLLHFGLAQNTAVDSIQIKWPLSQMVTKKNLNCNNIYTFKE